MTLSEEMEYILLELDDLAQPIPIGETVAAARRRWTREERVVGWANMIMSDVPDFSCILSNFSLPRIDKDALAKGRIELTRRDWPI